MRRSAWWNSASSPKAPERPRSWASSCARSMGAGRNWPRMSASSLNNFDVVIAGFGPVGAVCANLLGQAGIKTLVVERAGAVYDKPRAFALDHEIMRVFQNLGLAAAIAPHTAPFTPSEYYGVEG